MKKFTIIIITFLAVIAIFSFVFQKTKGFVAFEQNRIPQYVSIYQSEGSEDNSMIVFVGIIAIIAGISFVLLREKTVARFVAIEFFLIVCLGLFCLIEQTDTSSIWLTIKYCNIPLVIIFLSLLSLQVANVLYLIYKNKIG